MTRKFLVARPLNSMLHLPRCEDRLGTPLGAGMAAFFLEATLIGEGMPNQGWPPKFSGGT